MERAETETEAKIMEKMMGALSEDEQNAVAAYLGSLEETALAQIEQSSLA